MKTLLAWLLLCLPAVGGETIILVFDASGSMEEKIPSAAGSLISKMDAAKIAIIEGVGSIKGLGVTAGIVCFGDVPQKWMLEPTNIDDGDPNLIPEVLSKIKPGGGTPLAEYTKIGADKLLELREKAGNLGQYRLVIVTDGETTDSDKLLLEYVQDAISRGISISTIGIDMKQSHTLATKTNSYQDARDTKSLASAIKAAMKPPSEKIHEDISPKEFAQNATLANEIAPQLIYALSAFRNHPVGENSPIIVMDEGGGFIQLNENESSWTIGSVICVVLQVLIVFLAILWLILTVVFRD